MGNFLPAFHFPGDFPDTDSLSPKGNKVYPEKDSRAVFFLKSIFHILNR